MTRTAKSSSSESRNSKSTGRTTAKYVTVLVDGDGKLVNSIKADVKGTSDGNLTAQIRESLSAQGHTIPSKIPNDKSTGFIIELGTMKMIVRLLCSWRQCPNCGATSDSPTKGCPKCEESFKWTTQEIADFTETSK